MPEDLQAGLDDVKKFEDEMARQQEGNVPVQEQEKPKPVLTEEEKREEDRKENERLEKLRENFLALIKDRSASLVQITDEKKLLELLNLSNNYTQEQLERSLNAVDDLLSDNTLDYDRRMSIEKYLRNTADKLPREGDGKEEEIDEATRLAKVKENFRRLIIDDKYDLFQITDNDKLAVLLCLPKDFTQKQLEDSLNVADDVMSDKNISSEKQLLPEEREAYEKRVYDRQRTAEAYLRRNTLKGRDETKPEDKPEEKPDGTYAIKFDKGEMVTKIDRGGEKPEEEYTPIPPERSLVRLEGGPLAIIEEGKPVEAPKEKILIADVSEVLKAMAWRLAENRLNEIVNNNRDKTGDGKIKGFFKSQMARMGERGYLTKFYYEALEDMRNNQDLLAEIRGRMMGRSEYVGSDPAKAEQWQILDQVVREMEEGVLESCEKGEDIENSGMIFADLINRHIAGEFADRGAFEAAAREAIEAAISSGQIRREQFATDKGRQGEAEGLMYASNLYEIAEAQRAKIEAKYESGEWSELSPEQKKTIAEHINATGNLDIRLATKLRDINEERPERPDQTRGYLRGMDRIAQFARSRPILGAIINPTTLGLMSSMAVRSPARMAAMAGVGALGVAAGFALPILVGAGLGGVFAYARRHNALAHDRGLEQRREAIGQQGQGARAERLRDFGFSGIGRSAESLLTDVTAGNADSTLEAAALFQAERELRDEGRPVDLITTEQGTGEQFKTNYIPKTELKIAIRDQIATLDKGALDARVAEIKGQIAAQDSGFEKFRGKESWKALAVGAVGGAIAGAAAIEIKDYVQEHFMGQATGTTMLEYAQGERPTVAHYELGGQDLMPMDKVHHSITMPDTGEKVDIEYQLGDDGHLTPVQTGLPEGYNFDPAGNLVHHVDGMEGGPVTAENWDQMRGILESQHEGLLEQQHVSWSGFGYNENAPSGNSYTEFYIPRAEGTELQMDFIGNQDGSVTVSAERMLGHVAFSGGKEVKITPDMLDKLVATISPRDRVLQHEALVAHIQDGKITFPKDLAEKIFSLINGKVEPKPGIQITLDQVVHGGDEGQTSLYSIAEDHAEGVLDVPPIPPIDEVMPPPADPTYVPPTEIVPPVVIPWDRRKPIGDVESGKKGEEQGAGEKENKEKKGKFKIIDQKNKVVLWAAKKSEEREKAKLAADESHKLEAVKEQIANTPDEAPGELQDLSKEPTRIGEAIPLGPIPKEEPRLESQSGSTEKPNVEKMSYDKVEGDIASVASRVPEKDIDFVAGKLDSVLQEKNDFEKQKVTFLRHAKENGSVEMIAFKIPVKEGEGWKYITPEDLKPENQADFASYLEKIKGKLKERSDQIKAKAPARSSIGDRFRSIFNRNRER